MFTKEQELELQEYNNQNLNYIKDRKLFIRNTILASLASAFVVTFGIILLTKKYAQDFIAYLFFFVCMLLPVAFLVFSVLGIVTTSKKKKALLVKIEEVKTQFEIENARLKAELEEE